jgi:hypothetical protein
LQYCEGFVDAVGNMPLIRLKGVSAEKPAAIRMTRQLQEPVIDCLISVTNSLFRSAPQNLALYGLFT